MDKLVKKISIIIPCYNAQHIISRTLESLECQTIGIDSLEIICVDDNSTDKTYDVLCDWEKRYPESFVIVGCKENGRQGRARNIGLEYSTCQYIGFVDDDDIVLPQMYEVLFENAIQNNCDISMCRYDSCGIDRASGALKENYEKQNDAFYIIDSTNQNRFISKFDIPIWNKIYKKELIERNNIYFLEGVIYDDLFFSGLICNYAKSVYITNNVFYYHIDSLTNASDTKDIKLTYGYIQCVIQLYEQLLLRGLYYRNVEYYRKRLAFEYLRFIYVCFIKYGGVDIGVWNIIKNFVIKTDSQILGLNPEDIFIDSREVSVNCVLWNSLTTDINNEYIENVIGVIYRSFST